MIRESLLRRDSRYANSVTCKQMTEIRKYNPQYANSRNWNEIQEWYMELTELNSGFKPIMNLVKHINESEIRNRIYAYTSVHKLIAGIYELIEWNSEALHIEYDLSTEQWFFRYYPKPFKPVDSRENMLKT